MTVHKFKITDGCPKTGRKIACNTTQDANAFSSDQPTAEERAAQGMAAHAAQRANQRAHQVAKEAERTKTRQASKAHQKNAAA